MVSYNHESSNHNDDATVRSLLHNGMSKPVNFDVRLPNSHCMYLFMNTYMLGKRQCPHTPVWLL